MTSEVTAEDLEKILTHFASNYYSATGQHPICEQALLNCIELAKLDYTLMTIKNDNGALSLNYPTRLIVFESELQQPLNGNSNSRTTDTIYENSDTKRSMVEAIHKARLGRCRARFPVPVIYFKGKHICRSSTVASESEMILRRSYESFSGRTPDIRAAYGDDYPEDILNQKDEDPEYKVPEDLALRADLSLYDRVRRGDISYLRSLNVTTIADLMVERKKVKFNIYVSSSEKVDRDDLYKDFNLICLPYPGCEFFFEFRQNDYNGSGLIFKWEQSFVDATLSVPHEMSSQLRIDWDEYKSWDVILLTQNYLKVILKHLHESTSGLLIHCISGWDRTPLFVSLLRMSLWADGMIHQKLSATQILYYTLAYDWMLFGHDLNDRINKGEEIMYFCFYMLKFIVDDDFSIFLQSPRKSKHSGGGSTHSVNSTESTTTSGGESVIRTDSDCQLDSVMLEDTHGSNVSVNSTESFNSNKETESTSSLPMLRLETDEILNGNSPQQLGNTSEVSPPMSRSLLSSHQRRTSPIAVPSQLKRQRNDSTSSLTGWCMVTNTGSVRSEFAETSGYGKPEFGAHTHILADEELTLMRLVRLNEVRALFQTHYGRVVGSRMNNYEANMKGVISSIAESVGLR